MNAFRLGEGMHKRIGASLLLVAGALVMSACSGATSESTQAIPSTTLATATSTREAIQISASAMAAARGCMEAYVILNQAMTAEDVQQTIVGAVSMLRAADGYRTAQPLQPDDEQVYQMIESCDGIGKTILAGMIDSGIQNPNLDQYEPILGGAWDYSAEEWAALPGDLGFYSDSYFEAVRALEYDLQNWEAP